MHIAQDRPEAEAWRSVVLRDASAPPLDALGLDSPPAEVFAGVDLTGPAREA